MIQKNVTIRNKYNKDLSAIIEIPKGDVKDFVIISHCFTCSKLYNNIGLDYLKNLRGESVDEIINIGDVLYTWLEN